MTKKNLNWFQKLAVDVANQRTVFDKIYFLFGIIAICILVLFFVSAAAYAILHRPLQAYIIAIAFISFVGLMYALNFYGKKLLSKPVNFISDEIRIVSLPEDPNAILNQKEIDCLMSEVKKN